MKVQVCTGKSCSGKFSKYIITRLENDKKFYMSDAVKIVESGCMGDCKKGPNMRYNDIVQNYCTPSKASQLIQKNINNENI